MLTRNIFFKNFRLRNNQNKTIIKYFKNLINYPNQILLSLEKNYKDSYNKTLIDKFKNKKNYRLIGMGGSILGAKAIYSFLEPKFKNFEFIDHFSGKVQNKTKKINIVISKSGNTLETISNVSVFLKKKENNIFITEKKKSYLSELANKLKTEIINHNNYIGGRYSVLSEVGMLPAHLMGFDPKKFRRLNNLIKNKRFVNSLVSNVSNIIHLSKKKLIL